MHKWGKIEEQVDQQTQKLDKILEIILKIDAFKNQQTETTKVSAAITTSETTTDKNKKSRTNKRKQQ